MKIKPVSLEIDECPLLSNKALAIINKYGENLESLNFGSSGGFKFPTLEDILYGVRNESLADWDAPLGLLNTPNLRRLTIWGKCFSNGVEKVDFVDWLIRRFIGKLEHLDLSFSDIVKGLDFLVKAKDTLKFLSLNCAMRSNLHIRWDVLTYLHKLTFLDLPKCFINDEQMGILTRIVESLPELKHLGLSQNRLAVSQVNDGSRRYRINALASRERRPLEFVDLYDTGTSRYQLLVPARVVVMDKDKLFSRLVSVIMFYSQTGELPTDMIDRLEMISKQRMADNGRFPWKEAVNLVLEVVGPKLDYSVSRAISIFHDALKEPDQLARVQKDEILKCFVKELNQDWRMSFRLEGTIDDLFDVSQSMDLWDLPNAKNLVVSVVRIARTAIKKYKNNVWEYYSESGVNNSFPSLLRRIGQYLSKDLSDRAVNMIRTFGLDQELISVLREVMEVNLELSRDATSSHDYYINEDIGGLYWKICDKIVIRKLGF